jgi:hypothetical protein
MDLAFANPKSEEPAESQDDLLGMGGGESQAPSSNTPTPEASADPFDVFGAPIPSESASAAASPVADPFDAFGATPQAVAPASAGSDPFDVFGGHLPADENALPVPSVSEIPNPSEPVGSSIPTVDAIPQQATPGDDPTDHSQQQPTPSVDAIPEQSQPEPDDASAQPEPSVDGIPEQSPPVKEGEQPMPPVDAIPDQSQASDATNAPPAPLVDEIPQQVNTTPSEELTETVMPKQEEVVETEPPAESDPQSTDSQLDPSIDAIPKQYLLQDGGDESTAGPQPLVNGIPQQQSTPGNDSAAKGNTPVDPSVDGIPQQPLKPGNDAAETPPESLVGVIPHQTGVGETTDSPPVPTVDEIPAETETPQSESTETPVSEQVVETEQAEQPTAVTQMDPSVDAIPDQSQSGDQSQPDPSVDGIPEQSTPGDDTTETPPESFVGAIPNQAGVGDMSEAPPSPSVDGIPTGAEDAADPPPAPSVDEIPEEMGAPSSKVPGTTLSEQAVEAQEGEQPTDDSGLQPSVDAIPGQSQQEDRSGPEPTVDGIPEQFKPGDSSAEAPPESLVGAIPDQAGAGDTSEAPPSPSVDGIPAEAEDSADPPPAPSVDEIPEEMGAPSSEVPGATVSEQAVEPQAGEQPTDDSDLQPSVDAIPGQSQQEDRSGPDPTVDGIPEQSEPGDSSAETPPESLVGAIPDQARTGDATDAPPTPIVDEIPEQSAAAPSESTSTPIPEQTETETNSVPMGVAVPPEAENPGGARAIPEPVVVAVVGHDAAAKPQSDTVVNPTQKAAADQSIEPSMSATPARPAAAEAVMSVPSTPDPTNAPDNSPDTPLPGSVNWLQKELHAAHMKIMHLQERHAQEDEGPTLAVLEEFQNNLQLQMSQKAEAEVATRRANAQVKKMEDDMDVLREQMESRCEGLNKDLLKAVEDESIMELELKKAREEKDEEERKQIALTNRLNSVKKKEFTKSNITEHYGEQVENLEKQVQEYKDKFAAETTEKERLAKELADWKQYSEQRIQNLEKAVNDEKKLNEERKRKMKGFVEAKAEEIRSAKADNMSLQTELDQTNKSLLELNQRFKQLHEQWIQSQTRNRELQRDINKMKTDSEKMHKVGDTLEMKLSRSALETEEHKNKRVTAKNELMAVLKQLETERNLTNRLRDSIKFTFTPKALSQQQIIQETLQEFESELERLATRLGRPLPPPPVTGNELFIEMMSEQTLDEPAEGDNQDGEGTDRPNASETTTTRMLSKLESETQRLSQCIMALQTSVERMHGVLDGSGTRNCVSALQGMFLSGSSSQTASSEERAAITSSRRVAGTTYGQVPNAQIT